MTLFYGQLSPLYVLIREDYRSIEREKGTQSIGDLEIKYVKVIYARYILSPLPYSGDPHKSQPKACLVELINR